MKSAKELMNEYMEKEAGPYWRSPDRYLVQRCVENAMIELLQEIEDNIWDYSCQQWGGLAADEEGFRKLRKTIMNEG